MYKRKWYLQTWLISLIFAFSIFIIPAILGIILLCLKAKENKIIRTEHMSLLAQIEELKSKSLETKKEDLEKINTEINTAEEKLKNTNIELTNVNETLAKNRKENTKLSSNNELLLAEEKKLSLHIKKLNSQIHENQALINKNKKSIKLAEELISKKEKIESDLKEKQMKLIVLEDELLLQSFGFYDPKFNLENSQEYKDRLEEIRMKQKHMVKTLTATDHYDNWQLDGSKQKGKVMNDNNIKLTLRAFNNECDSIISKAKFNNIESYEKRIRSAYSTLNKVNKHNRIEITNEYLSLKIDELYLAYEYELKLREEKEEQQRIKEQLKEEAKAQREIELMKEKIHKEQKHFSQEIENLTLKLDKVNESEKETYLSKIKELEEKLKLLEKDKQNVFEREQNTRAGYVYIISNIGSFGDNIYKIGMTRRLEPMDRIKELGDASVPFSFDVHALIFSEDAPKLENELHKAFDNKKVNMVNNRKEFFKVTLQEIEQVVKSNHNKAVEFTKLAQAEEYRISKAKWDKLYMINTGQSEAS